MQSDAELSLACRAARSQLYFVLSFQILLSRACRSTQLPEISFCCCGRQRSNASIYLLYYTERLLPSPNLCATAAALMPTRSRTTVYVFFLTELAERVSATASKYDTRSLGTEDDYKDCFTDGCAPDVQTNVHVVLNVR